MKHNYFEVTVRESREVTFLVEAPRGTKACDLEADLDDSNLVLTDSSLDNDEFSALVGGKGGECYIPITETEAVKLRRKPRGKKPAVVMLPEHPDDPESELKPVPYSVRKRHGG